jgi:hypothetical protein
MSKVEPQVEAVEPETRELTEAEAEQVQGGALNFSIQAHEGIKGYKEYKEYKELGVGGAGLLLPAVQKVR